MAMTSVILGLDEREISEDSDAFDIDDLDVYDIDGYNSRRRYIPRSLSIRLSQQQKPNLPRQFGKPPMSKNAWLCVEASLEEIDVKKQSFSIEGWITLFWREDSESEKLFNSIFEHKELQSYIQALRKNGRNDEESNDDDEPIKKKHSHDNNTRLIHSVKQYGKRPDIFIKFTKDGIQHMEELGFKFPFYWSTSNRQFQIFRNEISYTTIGESGTELEYNYDHKVFKLHIHFRATLYECFENNYNDFPFEWQFLNCQLLLNVLEYSFRAKRPAFVKDSFMFFAYWGGSTFIWEHTILVRKRENIEGWKLLSPWIDLRDDNHRWEDYGHEYHFSLIKLRVVRNPSYYLSYIIVPLFLMVSCAFAVFCVDPGDGVSDRLAYIVTLLLTVAAFQITVSADLPFVSQFTLIDRYFLLGYYVLALLVLESCIAKAIVDDEESVEQPFLLDIFFGTMCGCIWIVYSLKYLVKWRNFERLENGSCDIFRKCLSSALFCCDCWNWRCANHYKNHQEKSDRQRQFEYWLEMDRKESAQWDRMNLIHSKSKKAEIVYGTKGDITISTVVDGKEVYQYYVEDMETETGVNVLWRIDEKERKIKKVIDLTQIHGEIVYDDVSRSVHTNDLSHSEHSHNTDGSRHSDNGHDTGDLSHSENKEESKHQEDTDDMKVRATEDIEMNGLMDEMLPNGMGELDNIHNHDSKDALLRWKNQYVRACQPPDDSNPNCHTPKARVEDESRSDDH